MITETIASSKPVNTAKGKKVIVLTTTGKQVWVPEHQFDTNAETVSFIPHLAGSEYKNPKTGEVGKRKEDSNEFVGCGKASKFAVIDYLVSKGITPTFSLS